MAIRQVKGEDKVYQEVEGGALNECEEREGGCEERGLQMGSSGGGGAIRVTFPDSTHLSISDHTASVLFLPLHWPPHFPGPCVRVSLGFRAPN